MNIVIAKKTAAFVAAGVMLLNTAMPILAADTSITIIGNGAQSDNTANTDISSSTQVTQSNTANVTNNISTNSNTGDNSISGITGGNASIDTGTSSTQVTVKNALNSNVANVNGCCTNNTNVTIKDNGFQSSNTANTDVSNNTTLWQTNKADVSNNVSVNQETGDNSIKNSTNGEANISTGDANTDIKVSTLANSNVAQIGNSGGSGGSATFDIIGNGAQSKNKIEADISSAVVLGQINDANIQNNVKSDSNTGDNEISGITGGAVGIQTGTANTTVGVDNLVNFNSANIDCGECLTNVFAKIAGNGFDSKNTIDGELNNSQKATQQNDWSCGLRPEVWLDSFIPLDGNKGKGCNNVATNAETGDNTVKNSTFVDPGIDPWVHTGDSNFDNTVTNVGNSNIMGQQLSNPILEELMGLNFSFNLNDVLGSLHLI